jgi:adenylate kinase
MMRIVITGTPGTGKSLIACELSRCMDLELIDIKKIVHEKRLLERHHEVDIKKLARALGSEIKKIKNKGGYVIEGHLACEMKIPADYIFVLRSSPKVLRARFAKRHYPKKKILENIEAELLDYCAQRIDAVYGRAKKPRILELDTSKRSVSRSTALIAESIRLKKKKLDIVVYPLADYLGLGRK